VDNELIFHISSLLNKEKLTQHLEFIPDESEFVLTLEHGSDIYKIRAQVSPRYQQVTLHFSVGMGPQGACLLACAGASLVKPLIECFDPDIQKYIDCLKIKGLVAAYEVAACAAGCFTSNTAQ
jgi:hypothetical protein